MNDKWNLYYKIAAASYGRQKSEEIDKEMKESIDEAPFDAASWKQIQLALKKEQHKTNQKHFKFLKVAASIFLVISIIGATAVTNIEALRIKVYNFLFDKHENFIQIAESGNVSNDYNLSGYFVPTLFPEGYHFTEIVGTGKNVDIYYSDANSDSVIIFKQREPEKTLTYDNENIVIHEITINGFKGFWGSKHGYTMVVWSNDFYIFSLLIPNKYNNFIEIAESVEFCK